MAVLKCKMCGGDLEVTEEMTVCECEYCGTRQTVPTVDDGKKIKLFERANKLRANCEFDKAAGVYENIVADYSEEAEGYWGLILCRYGIEYVDDPATGKKIPTCHRSSFDSVMDDEDFEMVMENSDSVSRVVYRDEAKYIEEVRKGIIEVSGKEEPYDIFICYKETDENGDRTLDSVLAQDVYDALTQKGYRVFFARISLESKLGVEYEPYIFAALNSAKIMLAFGTSYDYYNAVWVKNEWSRYLKLMAKDKTKHLIPCFKNVDAYDIPKEFAKLQSQDMGKIGAVQDLVRGIDKLLGVGNEKPGSTNAESASFGVTGANGNAFLKRGFMSIEDGEWNKATEFFEQVLNINAEDGQAYWGELLAHYQSKTVDELAHKLFEKMSNDASSEMLEVDLPTWCSAAQDDYLFWGLFGQDDIQKLFLLFDYESKVASVKGIIEDNKTAFVLETNRLYQRAKQYANATVNSEIEQLKNKLELLLHGFLEISKDEEKKAFDVAKEQSDSYYQRLRSALDTADNVARTNAIKNEEIFRNEHAEWEEKRDRYPFEHEQWEKEMVRFRAATDEWRTFNADALRSWDEAKKQYNSERQALENRKKKLEDEKAIIEGLFAEMRIAAKDKEIRDIRVKLGRLRVPEQPELPDQPRQPVEPVLRDEPVLSFESKVGKAEVLSVFYDQMKQEDEDTNAEN